MQRVERWGVFETAVYGKADGNPFLDRVIAGTLVGERERVTVNGRSASGSEPVVPPAADRPSAEAHGR